MKQKRLRPSTAFEEAHASWDNAWIEFSRGDRGGRQGGSGRGALDARFSDKPVLLQTAIWAQPQRDMGWLHRLPYYDQGPLAVW